MRLQRVLALLALFTGAAASQPNTPPVRSPEVHADKKITFRFRAPNAKEVAVSLEGNPRVPMSKDESGLWTVTTGPLEPDYYGYSFSVDGNSVTDPVNHLMKPNLLRPSSMVHVPGTGLPWEVADVPRGNVHHHFYRSKLIGDDRDYFVYTPPGYDGKKTYPVFYLLHGYSDDASGWTSVGRAHVILDNLIAQGKAKPMVMVMPLGYGAPEVVSQSGPLRDRSVWERNATNFRKALMDEVLPQVESAYRVSKDRKQRAIAGLSMGGMESLYTGLNELDRFAWVGSFSAGGLADDPATAYPQLSEKGNEQLKLLWIACGKEDRLIASNHKLVEWLKSKGIKHTWTETPGAHTWMVWRRYLAEFTPLLFRD